jgi:hypothetical protein
MPSVGAPGHRDVARPRQHRHRPTRSPLPATSSSRRFVLTCRRHRSASRTPELRERMDARVSSALDAGQSWFGRNGLRRNRAADSSAVTVSRDARRHLQVFGSSCENRSRT